jgi:hypothetical protein
MSSEEDIIGRKPVMGPCSPFESNMVWKPMRYLVQNGKKTVVVPTPGTAGVPINEATGQAKVSMPVLPWEDGDDA